MAKHNVTYSCGHQGVENLFGPHRDRERRISYLESSGLCAACYARKKESERAAASIAAERAASSAGLPALEGTERQVAWAETLRREFCAQVERQALRLTVPEGVSPGLLDALKENPLDAASWGALADQLPQVECGEDGALSDAMMSRGICWVLAVKDAKWWIDHRYSSGLALAEEAAREPARLAREAELLRRRQEAGAQEQRRKADEAEAHWREMDAVAAFFHGLFNDGPGDWVVRTPPAYGGRPATFGPFASQAEALAFAADPANGPLHRCPAGEGLEVVHRPPAMCVTEVKVWDRGDRRVYFGRGYEKNVGCLYVTGNDRYSPGYLEITKAGREAAGDRLEELKSFCAGLAKRWKNLTVDIAEDGTARRGR